MATTTRNLLITKPAGTDPADIAVINTNMDLLDDAPRKHDCVDHELAGAVSTHQGAKRAVHGISDANRLVYAHQLGYDPYSRVVPFPRWARTSQTLTDSTLFLTYLMPTMDVRATKFYVESAATASVGSTLLQFSLYELGADGALTLRVTSADVHASVLNAANTFYEPAFSSVSSFQLLQGLTYAVGLLAVGQSTPATLWGANVGLATFAPVLCNTVASQTTTPSTVAAGSLVASPTALWLGCEE